MNREAILRTVQSRLPGLLALYAFGSRVTGTAGAESDLDLAVLVEGYADPLLLWELSGDLAELAGCQVDLLDLRGASTVMQYQVITRGERWWAADVRAGLFEAAILSEKTELDGAREEYERDPLSFAEDYTRQDAAILNIQRACEAALDMGQHLIRRERLGVPQSARDVFTPLARAGWLDSPLADTLKRMVGFRNIALHDYQSLQLPITVSIIERHLDDFLRYSQSILLRDARSS